MDDSTSPTPPRGERRAAQRLLYTADQALGRAPIWLRRRADKLRLAGHLAVVIALTALSLWWVIPEHTFSGRVLMVLAPGRGIHVGDLATLLFAVIVGRSLRSVRRLRRRG